MAGRDARREPRRRRGRPRRTAARDVRPAARGGARPARAAAGDRHRADPQRPCGLRPEGAGQAVLRGARLAGAVGLRPDRGVRAARGPVPGAVAVGRAGRDRHARVRAPRALSARAGTAVARRARRRGEGLLRDPGAHRDLRSHPRRRTAQARRPHQGTRPVPGRSVDRHRVARDHGECGPQRHRRGGRRPRRAGRPRDHLFDYEEAA